MDYGDSERWTLPEASASALTCKFCSPEEPPPCNGSSYSADCPAGTICSSLVYYLSTGEENSTNLIKGCVQEPMCNKTVVLQITNYKIMHMFSCCSTNDCTPTVLPLPDTNTQLNGLWCPTCDSSSTCSTLLCTGSETYCFLQSLYGVTVQGCASESCCQASNYFRSDSLTYTYGNISCVNANPISSLTTIGTTIYTSVDAGNAHENNECGNAGSSLKCPGYHSIFLGVAGVVLGMLKISF